MQFTSFQFLLFLPIVFLLYYLIGTRRFKAQNVMLLIASYYFYGSWDYRFLFLLIFSTTLDYFSGIQIFRSKTQSRKKFFLIASIIINLGFLGYFKYYNFFINEFVTLLNTMGFNASVNTLNILLPVGISFYTFHGLSYVFDIYYERIKPTYDIVNYSLFVSFFPLLVAGPIERANHLLPQIEKPRKFDYTKAVDGLRQILWGLFKKMVIADGCAKYANIVFDNYQDYSGTTLLLGAFLFAFQIYGDFSGYSDIALGVARLLGFELLQNFKFPYFSRSISEFWKRWHISLSSFFRDYVYIPLGGNRVSKSIQVRNVFIIFILSGLWHGANWTFLIWGIINAFFILPSILQNNKNNSTDIIAEGKLLPNIKELLQVMATFGITLFAWIFFRSSSLTHAINYIKGIFTPELFTLPDTRTFSMVTLGLIVFFLLIEWLGRERRYALEYAFNIKSMPVRWAIYLILTGMIFLFSSTEQQFIYFQF